MERGMAHEQLGLGVKIHHQDKCNYLISALKKLILGRSGKYKKQRDISD